MAILYSIFDQLCDPLVQPCKLAKPLCTTISILARVCVFDTIPAIFSAPAPSLETRAADTYGGSGAIIEENWFMP